MDFIRKAFDSFEWPFIMRTLGVFNFDTSIQKCDSTFYTNVESAALGFLTNWFRPSSGVRHWCPLSPYLFILSVEVMANKIRQDRRIKGIEILGNELSLSQFAILFCANLASVEKALEIVDNFGLLAGLKLYRKKTKAIWSGKWEKSKNSSLQLKWLRNAVKILGIHVSYDEKGNNRVQLVINRYEWFWKFSKLHEPLGECNLRIFKITSIRLIANCARRSCNFLFIVHSTKLRTVREWCNFSIYMHSH